MLWRIGAFLNHSSRRKQEMPGKNTETILLLVEIQSPCTNCLQSKSSKIKARHVYVQKNIIRRQNEV
jgi:hypothetical protein